MRQPPEGQLAEACATLLSTQAATRCSAWSSSPCSSSSVSPPARAPSRRRLESSPACTKPSALRQYSWRHGSGGGAAETTVNSKHASQTFRTGRFGRLAPVENPPLSFPWANFMRGPGRGHARPTAHDCRGGRRAALGRIALQEQARPSKPSAPPSQQAHHPAAHAGAHSAPQRSHTRVHSTQLTRPAFSVPIAVLFRPRRTGHTRLPPPPSR